MWLRVGERLEMRNDASEPLIVYSMLAESDPGEIPRSKRLLRSHACVTYTSPVALVKVTRQSSLSAYESCAIVSFACLS